MTLVSHRCAAAAALHDAGVLEILERALKTAGAALAAGAADDLWMAWTGAALDEGVVFEHQRRAVVTAGTCLAQDSGPEPTANRKLYADRDPDPNLTL